MPALFEILAMGDGWQVGWDKAAEGFGVGFKTQVSAAGVCEPEDFALKVSNVRSGRAVERALEHGAWIHRADDAVGKQADDEQPDCSEPSRGEAGEPFNHSPLLHPREDEQADGSGPDKRKDAGDEEPEDEDEAGAHCD